MKMWQVLLTVLATLASAASLTMGPVTLAHNNRFINFTKGASPDNSLLRCGYKLEGVEEVARVSWKLTRDGEKKGTYDWDAESGTGEATGELAGVVNLDGDDGSLQLTELRYGLSGEYSCSVELTNGEVHETNPWEVLIVDSMSQQSVLHTNIKDCIHTSRYSTLATFPEPSVRAGLYSSAKGGFYKEIPSEAWDIVRHENGSVTYSFTDVPFELSSETPVDVSFYVVVAVMKADGNYIPISSAADKDLILHHLGCPEPRLEEYQNIFYHRDTVTCRGEHRDTEATVSCREGYHADGPVDEVMVRCEETTHTWVLEDGTPARREHLGCVINQGSNNASLSGILIGFALVFLKLAGV